MSYSKPVIIKSIKDPITIQCGHGNRCNGQSKNEQIAE